MRNTLLVQLALMISCLSLTACETAQDDATTNDIAEVSTPNEIAVAEPQEPQEASQGEQHSGLDRCLGTWEVSADSGKFDRTGYTFTVKLERDSLLLHGHTGQLDDGYIGYELAEITQTASGWSGITKDEYLRNETTWRFTSETTAILDVDGYRVQTNEYLGQKRIFLTKK